MLHNMPTGPIDLRNLRPGRRPNHFFIAPVRYGNLAADATCPPLSLDADRLFALAVAVIERQPRVRRTALDRVRRQAVFEQRSAGFGFVDDIDLAAEPLGATQAALAIYSRSRLGFWDFGVNRRRALGWLAEICAEVRPALPPLETAE
jgi:uncharacterized protein (DUF1499 family)